MAFGSPPTPLAQYKSRFGKTPGYFVDTAIGCWDFLLGTQRAMGVSGSVLEIGVFQGKSAFLAACHMQKHETLILNDINPLDSVVAQIAALDGPATLTVQAKSYALVSQADLGPFQGTARWLHIDGDHTGFNTMSDLLTMEHFLGDKGIICVDDFFSLRYPQVAAMVFRFLDQRAPVYRMFLCGSGKAYICRSDDFGLYEGLVRKYLAQHLRQLNIEVSLHKSTYSHDGGCFGIGPREDGRDYIGLDADPSDIPG